ncbi:right-handed parallel beta-helix repeat-containing protein [Halovivax cerinus]|uniref:Right-handed parallel beta-helix repeat-containing protein n=1 Tax=Halovivax cerinus TaxID=1487865 RepID=A0ABD5NU52_9EURY|nr:right-handed parallel beta-helix repeat-containing protein [Halovivax cerinus]
MNETDRASRLTGNRETSRRRYLLGAGTALGSLGLVSGASGRAAGATGYETITVGAGETYRKSLSDDETWENKLIDITAPGAGYRITASANNFEIRNIGIRGRWDHDPGSQAFVVYVPNAGATGRIENCYVGDGATGTDPGGLFVHRKHRGTLTVDRFTVQGMGDNGIYASAPGYGGASNGGQGDVHIRNSYAANNRSSGFRLGSSGSTIENSSMWGNDRGLWCLFDHVRATNCDMGDNGIDVRVGSGSQEAGGPYGELTVDSCRYGTTQIERSQNAIYGSSLGSPRRRGPADVGAPASAEAAARGAPVTGDENETTPDRNVHTLDVAGQFAYRVEVSGEIRPADGHTRWLTEGESYGDDWAEWWLSGSDSARTVWEFTGEITSLEIDDHDGTTELRTLAVDGEELDHGEYVDTGPHRLDVAGQFAYRVEVSGEIRPVDAHAKWLNEGEAYGDDWAEWWLSGSDSARTVWEFTGEITNLDVDDYDGVTDVRTLAVDGEPIDEV